MEQIQASGGLGQVNATSNLSAFVQTLKGTKQEIVELSREDTLGFFKQFSKESKKGAQAQADFIDELKQSQPTIAGYLQSIGDAEPTFQGYQKYCQEAAQANKQLSASFKALTIAKKAFSIIGNMAIGYAVVKVFQTLTDIVDELHVTMKEAQESLEESMNTFKDITSELDGLNNELETCTKKIVELQKLADAGTISVADEAELEKLKETNDELERQIALKQAEQIQAQKEVLKDNKQVLNNKVAGYYASADSITLENVSVGEEMKAAIDAYEKASNSSKKEDAADRAVKMYDILSPSIEAYKAIEEAGGKLTDDQRLQYESLLKLQDEYLLFNYSLNGTKQAFVALNEEQQRNILLNRLVEQGLTNEYAQAIMNSINPEDYYDLWDKDFSFALPMLSDYATAEEYGKAYAKAWMDGVNTVLEVSSFSKSEMIDVINGMVDGFDVLDDIYSDVYDKESFDFTKLDTKKFEEAFKGLEEEYTAFIETVSSSPDDIEACQEAFNDLVSAYINSNDIFANVTDETANVTIAMLENMGVVNAEAIVTDTLAIKAEFLAKAKENEAIATEDLNSATTTEIAALINENNVLDDTTLSIINYHLAKINANQNALSTEGDIEALSNLVTALGGTTDALSEYANYKSLVAKYTSYLGNGIYDDENTQKTIDYYTGLMNKAFGAAQTEVDAVVNKSLYKPIYEGGDTTEDTKKSIEDSKKTFDWVETALSRIQRTITNLGKLVSATYRKWGTRNSALAEEMSAVNQEIALQLQAYETYTSEANSVGLPKHYKELIESGALNIQELGDSDKELIEQIELYQEWYDKALGCADAIEDLRANLAELAMTEFNNVSKQYDDQIALIEHRTNMLDGYIGQSEAAGYWASEVYYQKLAETELTNISQLQSQYNDLITAFNENVNNGSIEKYSEDWYSMYSSINEVEEALQAANTALIEYNQTLQQIRWDLFDRGMDYKNDLVDEANFLIDLLDNEKLHNDNGSLNDNGLSVQGLHAMNYNIYMEESAKYAEEIQKINEELANDPNDLELIDRRNELISLQQESIQNAMSEKEAIKDLVSDGYDQMLSSLQEVIDKRKEALNAERDLYQYQNDIKEKTDTISGYKKQLQAYVGDNSEEAKATVQKLQLSLEEAERDLEQTEYEKWLSDQESMLDDLYDQTEEWVNGRLDSIDSLIQEAITATNANASTISSALNTEANALGYTLSSAMSSIWDSQNTNSDVTNVVMAYGDILNNSQSTINTSINSGVTTVKTALDTIDNDILKMINALNAQAIQNNVTIASAQEQSANTQSSSDIPTAPPNNPGGNSGSQAPAIQDHYTVLDNNTRTVLYTGTKSACNSWIEKNHYKIVSTGGNTIIVRPYQYALLDKQKNVQAGGLTYAQAYGRMQAQGNKLGWTMNAYASGTTNAKRGLNLIAEAGDELVLDNQGNAILASGTQLYPFEGGETVLNATDTANVLKSALVPLNEQAFLSGMTKKSGYATIQGLHRTSGNVSNDIKMSITLPNVTDYNSFVTQLKGDKRFEKIVQSMTIDSALGKNSLSKNKL